MGQMLVRNLDDAVIERLKQKAQERGTSLEQVARDVLTEAAKVDERAAWVAQADALRAQTRFDPTWNSVAVIREWRDRDRMTRLHEEWEAERAAAAPKPEADKG